MDELAEGVTLDAAGEVVDVDPLGVIFNDAMPLMAAHMVIAAYVVGGFLIAIGVRRRHAARAAATATTALGFLIPFSVAAIATPIQMGVGDSLARWVYNNQPIKFAAIELVPETSSDVPETLLGRLNSDGTVSGRDPDPRAGVVAVGPEHGTRTPSSRASTPSRRTIGRPSARSTPCTWPGT